MAFLWPACLSTRMKRRFALLNYRGTWQVLNIQVVADHSRPIKQLLLGLFDV